MKMESPQIKTLSLKSLEEITNIPRGVFWVACKQGRLRHKFIRVRGRKPEIRVTLNNVNDFLKAKSQRAPFYPRLVETFPGQIEVNAICQTTPICRTSPNDTSGF